MLRPLESGVTSQGACVRIGEASFPTPFSIGLEYASPARGTWNIVHTGMLVPEAHEIFVCAAGCLRGVVLTAAEMGAAERFSTVAVREENLLNGDLEDLIVEGVTDILHKLPKRPPAVLVYTSCVHHFTGCDLDMVYDVLRRRFPDVDFTDCYMNPIMRKSGLTPDQLMRRQLYSLLKPRPLNEKTIAILGNDFATDPQSELLSFLRGAGFTVREITDCQSYEEYQSLAESAWYLTYYTPAKPGAQALAARLGGTHLHLPFSLDADELVQNYAALAQALGIRAPELRENRARCEQALSRLRQTIGSVPIAIDYTAVPRPLGLARLLLSHGMNVRRVYCDSFEAIEKADFEAIRARWPDVELFAVTHAKMRFLAEPETDRFLAIGQKAAHFTGTNHFVNIVQGGGLYGFAGIEALCAQIEDAFVNKKDMKRLIQIKGLGCGGCV